MGSDTATLNRPPTFSGREASQDADELAGFVDLLQREGVTRYGEIGAREGDTFHAVMCSLPAGSHGVALDYPGGAWGNVKTRAKLERCIADLRARGYKVSALFGDSTTTATMAQFRGRGPYDAILIDGDHRLAGVTADWQNYRSVARIIAFHDIVGEGMEDKRGNPVQVPTLWKAIRALGLVTMEFVSPGSKMGIGVVWTQ
jgi:hypothetical protein